MRKFGIEFHFLSPSKVCLGIEYLQGIIHEEEDSYYNELVIGFLFFYIEITIRKVIE
jgi:hypothetical protein